MGKMPLISNHMEITWYPLQLFVRRLELVIPLGISLALAVALTVWVAVVARHIKEPVFLHYSIELGVDAAGTAREALMLPLLLVIFVIALTACTNALVLVRRQFALLVACVTPAIVLLGGWCIYLMLRANGAI